MRSNAAVCEDCGQSVMTDVQFCPVCGNDLRDRGDLPDLPDHLPSPSTPPLETLVDIGSYITAAGVGGIIGNRADAALVRTATRMFQSVRKRWSERTATGENAALSKEEAVDAATGAALTKGYDLDELVVDSAEQVPDGGWIVMLMVQGSWSTRLRVRVPPGDPATATLLILG
jgi:hypothetical protein